MNSVVEKLAAIEKEIAAIQPKMEPITERIAALDQKVVGFAHQLTSLAEESAAVKQDIELTRQSLTRIQTLIGESRAESEQLVAGQEENLQRCETMTAVFGAAFQAVSQFFETAQRMGLADQAKAVFLPPSSVPATFTLPQVPIAVPAPVSDFTPVAPPASESLEAESSLPEQPSAVKEPVYNPDLPIPEPVAKTMPPTEPPAEESVIEEPILEQHVIEKPIIEEKITAEPVAKEVAATEIGNTEEAEGTDLPAAGLVAETMESEPVISEPPAELPTETELPTMKSPVAKSILSESDFDSAISDFGEKELESWKVPGLPDVAAPPVMEAVNLDSESASEVSPLADTVLADTEMSSEMASQLDVSPLNLLVPGLPEPDESAVIDEKDEQEIEAMLATMMAPVTVGS